MHKTFALSKSGFRLIYFFIIILTLESLYLSSAEAGLSSLNKQKPMSHSSKKEFHNKISQNTTPPYICSIATEQTNPTPPTASWRSSVTCLPGIPTQVRTDVYYANVNFPTTFTYVGSNTFSCGTSSYCSSPTYSRPINRTQALFTSAQIMVRGTDGVVYSDPRTTQVIRPYNDKGVMYPQIKPTRLDMSIVPFYGPPYSVIATRNTTFARDLTAYYNSQGWTIPPNGQAHHIKPLNWGGDNNYIPNGVYLGDTTHTLFSNWWLQFSNLNW